MTPSVANAAISRFGGNDQADTNGGGAWGLPTPIIKDWDVANSTRNAASSTQVLTGGAARLYVPELRRFLQVDPVTGRLM